MINQPGPLTRLATRLAATPTWAKAFTYSLFLIVIFPLGAYALYKDEGFRRHPYYFFWLCGGVVVAFLALGAAWALVKAVAH